MFESFTTVAEVDWEGNIDESDEDNNRMTLHVDVVTEPLAELYISEIRVQPTSPQQGTAAIVGCRIHNGGTVDASGFKLIWYAAGPTIGCTWDGLTLAAGAARWEQCNFTYSGSNPNYTTTCIVDVDGAVDEIDEDNNELILMVNVRPD
jgi:subtilase family serine protease